MPRSGAVRVGAEARVVVLIAVPAEEALQPSARVELGVEPTRVVGLVLDV